MTPKELFERFMPDIDKIQANKYLQILGPSLLDPALWFLNRHSVAKAYLVGLICAFIPVPFQMVLAATGAIFMRANLPISVALVWLTNPLTMPPMFYMAYKVGAWVAGVPEQEFAFELSVEWLMNGMANSWQPFLLGCGIIGISAGLIGFCAIHLIWRGMVSWKWHTRRKVKSLPPMK